MASEQFSAAESELLLEVPSTMAYVEEEGLGNGLLRINEE
jgi:hypothetical protein